MPAAVAVVFAAIAVATVAVAAAVVAVDIEAVGSAVGIAVAAVAVVVGLALELEALELVELSESAKDKTQQFSMHCVCSISPLRAATGNYKIFRTPSPHCRVVSVIGAVKILIFKEADKILAPSDEIFKGADSKKTGVREYLYLWMES